jgi:RNA polymerase sigma-54 factor
MEMSHDFTQEMTVRVSPSLIEANHILSLSLAELRQTISGEIHQNPALEVLDFETCRVCGEVMQQGRCVNCSKEEHDTQESVRDELEFLYENYSAPTQPSSIVEDDDFDPMTLVASEMRMQDTLRADLHAVVPSEDAPLADYLIESLDDSGYLKYPIDSIADEMGSTPERTEWVLKRLQEVAPVGVGARDLRECLLLQVDYLEREGQVPEFVREIVSSYLDELGAHKYGYIARQLHTTPEAVSEARMFIKEHLTPFPSQDGDIGRTWRSPSRSVFVAPDVLITEKEGALQVEVMEGRQFELRLSPSYLRIATQLEVNPGSFSEDERRHIREYVSRTKLFISNVNQRRKTIHKIATCLMDLQEGFIRHGVRHLKPLTRAMLADHIGVHESTVSRATAGKFVMLPCRKVIPFSDFFTASLSVKDVIKEIITKENQALTDRQIGDRLRERGIRVARRTVAKYRAELGILPSTLR